MKESIIKGYLPLITEEKIEEFALKNNILLSKKEIRSLYSFIHDEKVFSYFLQGKEEILFSQLKKSISKENFLKIVDLYRIYKTKFF